MFGIPICIIIYTISQSACTDSNLPKKDNRRPLPLRTFAFPVISTRLQEPAAAVRTSTQAPTRNPLQSPDLNLGRPTALVPLSGHDHVVPGAQVQVALPLPLVKVLARIDGAADALGAADGPVLVKGGGALDRGLVDAPGLVDVVDAAVVLDGAEPLGARRRVVRAVCLDDVVLDERVGRPAVEGEVCITVSIPEPYYGKRITYSC